MTQSFGWHHTSETPVAVIDRSGLIPAVVSSPGLPGTPHLIGGIASGVRRAFGIQGLKISMPQEAISELINAGSDTKTILRRALEMIALDIERKSGNQMYLAAWRIAATIVRSYKPD